MSIELLGKKVEDSIVSKSVRVCKVQSMASTRNNGRVEPRGLSEESLGEVEQ